MQLRAARRLSRRLASIPSVLYALAYLCLWLLFAAIYTVVSDHFYHATTKYEAPIRWEAIQLTDEIDSVLQDVLQPRAVREIARAWHFDTAFVHVVDVRILEGQVIAEVRVIARSSTGQVAMLHPVLHCRQLWTLPDRRMTTYSVTAELNGDSARENLPVTPSELLAAFFGNQRVGNEGLLYVPEATQRSIEKVFARTEGMPVTGSDTFVRMLYFSAITITTVGYGDIVPITTLGRLLVSIEAVFGVVIIGLFLNSIAYEASHDL